MRRAWEQVFSGAGRAAAGEGEATAVADLDLSVATRETPLAELPLAPKVRNALERLELVSLGDLANFPAGQLVRLGGIGATTRREVNHLAQRLRETFEGGAVDAGADSISVDRLADQLVPKPPADEDHRTATAAFLGLAGESASAWPTHRETSDLTGLERQIVAGAVSSARARWVRRPEMTAVRRELVDRLARRGGVAGADELAALLLTERGSQAAEPLRTRRARAAVRASLEAEATLQQPRMIARRVGEAYLVALDGEIGEGEDRQTWNADRLLEAAAALGETAEEIVGRDSLPSSRVVVRELRDVVLPEGVATFDDARLVRLAAAASPRVSVSTRLELYPTGMPPERAIEESRAALLDRRGLDLDQVRDRIRARFPEAAPLPGRPELDRLLERIGLRWEPEAEEYQLPHRGGVLATFASSSRHSTSFATPDQRDAAIREIEDRLDGFVRTGGFLALTVDPRRLMLAAGQVAARTQAALLDLDRLLIDEMRTIVASAKNARWDRFLQADLERGERGWSVLTQVVDRAIPKVEETLYQTEGRVVATGLGLMARYDHFSLLERMRDGLTRTRSDEPLEGLILLVPGEDPSARPVVDGRPVPIITANQWAHLPSAWLHTTQEGEAA